MVDRIVDFALGQRLLVLLLAVVIVLWGAVSFRSLPIEAYPDVMDTQVQIISQWPGHAAEEAEQQVTVPLETAVNGIPGLAVMRSRSLFGLSIVYLNFQTGVTDDYARGQVVQRLQGINLPTGVSPQMSPQASATGEIYRYTLEGPPGIPLSRLKEIEDWTLEREFKSIPGVADVNSFGGVTKRYEVLLDPSRLQAYNITLSQVEQALANNNANAGGNYVERGSEEYIVRGVGLFRSLEDIGRTVITSRGGVPVLARDLGEVRIGHRTRLGKVGKNADDDVVEGIILLLRGDDADRVLDAIHEKVERLNGSGVLPTGVKIVTYADRTDLVHTTTHTVEHNLLMGIALVILVLLVFLGNARAALIVAAVIPLSLLFAFGVMRLEGISANLLSIGAVDFGIIVDGALIMVENIFRRLSEPHEDRDIDYLIATAAKDVQRPIFFSVTIIITAYLPMFTMQSVERKMFTPMAMTISCALFGALLLSLTLAPVLCTYLLRARLAHEDNLITRTSKHLYEPALLGALRQPAITVAWSLAALAGGLWLATRLGTEFLPHLDEGNLWVRATMPSTISYSSATRLVRQMRAVICTFPEITDVVSQNGRPDDGTDAVGFDDAEFYVGLKPQSDWPVRISKEQLIQQMNEKLSCFPGISWNFSQLIEDNVEEAMTGVKGELAVKVFGDDLNVLTQKASEIKNTMQSVQGISDLGIFDELGEPQINITPDREACARYGVNIGDVQDIVQTAIGGNSVTTFLDGPKQFDVVVRFKKEDRISLQAIREIPVSTPDGYRLPLSTLARVEYGSGAAFIYRESGQRFIAIKFSVRGRDLGSAIAEAQSAVKGKVKLPAGYSLQWGGEFQSMQRAQQGLMVIIPVSILLILALLYVTFGNVRHALLILLNIPFSVIGGILALYLTGFSLSVSAAVGFISVFGVAVLNGVILVSCFNQLRSGGRSLAQAVREGAMLRLRPVLMSALLAILGLLPAAISTGIGSDVQKPLAIVVIGGLVTATLLTILVLPVLYELIERRLEPVQLGE